MSLLLPAEYTNGSVLTRAVSDLRLESEKREITGVLAPYNKVGQVAPGLTETFLPGTFKAALKAPSRIKLRLEHNGPLVGHAALLEETADSLQGVLKVARSQAGNDLWALMEAGSLDSFSVEFVADRPKVSRNADDSLHVTHTRARLVGVAVVPVPSYDDAKIVSMRSQQEKLRETIILNLQSLTA